jgi:hypothetical protein
MGELRDAQFSQQAGGKTMEECLTLSAGRCRWKRQTR